MKTLKKSLLLSTIFIAIVFSSCKKDSPKVSTLPVSDITETTAKAGGNVTNEGDGLVTARGFVWGTNKPTLEKCDGYSSDSIGAGIFQRTLTNLSKYTSYIVRAYAVNKYGTSYGEDQIFSTLSAYPVITTFDASGIELRAATLGLHIENNGGSNITETGVYYGTTPQPELYGTKFTIGTGDGPYSAKVTGLATGTTYYCKAYATNVRGSSLGGLISFTTLISAPLVSTVTPSSLQANSAVAGVNVTDECGAEVYEKGIYYSKSPNSESVGTKIIIGTGIGSSTTTITGLEQATNYYVKAYAKNSIGTAYGEELSFKTSNSVPVVTTYTPTDYNGTSVKIGVIINNDGGAAVTENGIYWGTQPSPETTGTKLSLSSGVGTFTTTLTGLDPAKPYYFKAYGINSYGEAKGLETSINVPYFTSDKVFNSSLTYGTVTDIDGNTYKTIVIGTQTWFAENLRTTKYNDGTSVPRVTDASEWMALTSPAYCSYENNPANNYCIGVIYNWYVTQTGKICPTGWHVPTDNEWTTLTTYLGGESVAGGPMKEAGLAHWNSPNTGATNSSGFTAIPGGKRKFQDGTFTGAGVFDIWLSSSELTAGKPYYRSCAVSNTTIYRGSGGTRQEGNTIRCVKN